MSPQESTGLSEGDGGDLSHTITKIRPLAELVVVRERLRMECKAVVLTNGHFELLHPGHVRYLTQARSLGDHLIVAVNDDDSTRQLKGPGRPVTSETDRAEILAALACVDNVVIFHGNTAEAVVLALEPDIYVKGGDYSPKTGKALPEASTVRATGGRIAIVPLAAGYSTTSIIDKIARRFTPPPS